MTHSETTPSFYGLFTVFLSLALLLPSTQTIAESWDAPEAVIELPPTSLAQWYKPENKRQVFLHTMFRLRQSLQAVEIYSQKGDQQQLDKWATILQENYAKLPEMVPEWKDETRQETVKKLLAYAKNGDSKKLAKSIKQLNKICEGCHQQWKAVVTALYRSPDYSKLSVNEGQESHSYSDFMEDLADTLGVLKIAREDEELETARKAVTKLGKQLDQLGNSCSDCHRDPQPRERILGSATKDSLNALHSALNKPHDAKESGRHLGTVGFTVCGRCHSIHRTLGDIRGALKAE